MVNKEIRDRIISLIHQEVVPAIGCTEPICVALCTAKATEKLGIRPEKIEVLLSANILKNAMGVGIPGTGMIGLPIAIALGALIGKSDYQLEVLKDLTSASLEAGKQYVAENRITIQQKMGICEKLYAEVKVSAGDKSAGEAVGSSIYKYFSASMPLMDYWVDVIDEQQFQSYGMAFLHGVLNFFDIFLSKIGISFDLLNQTSFYIGQTESTFLYGLYDHGSFNAFVSVFYFFYMDFRWVGVIVGSLFFGFFCHRVERLANKNNLLNSALYLLIAQSVLKSFGRWEFYLTSYCLSFLFLRICFKRKMISDKTEGGENYGT